MNIYLSGWIASSLQISMVLAHKKSEAGRDKICQAFLFILQLIKLLRVKSSLFRLTYLAPFNETLTTRGPALIYGFMAIILS